MYMKKKLDSNFLFSKIHFLLFQKTKNWIHPYIYQQTRMRHLSAKSISFHSLQKKQNIEIHPYMYQQMRMYVSSLSKNLFHYIHLNKTKIWIHPYIMYQQTWMYASFLSRNSFHSLHFIKIKNCDQSIYVRTSNVESSLSKKSFHFLLFQKKKSIHTCTSKLVRIISHHNHQSISATS